MQSDRHRHLRGAALVSLGVLLLSPDSLVIELISADEGTLLFYRGVFMLVGFLVLLPLMGRPLRPATWRPDRHGFEIAAAAAVGNVCFVVSIRHIDAALALVILAAAPMFTIVLGRAFSADPVPPRTRIAAGVVFAGIAGVFLTGPDGGELIGVLAAVGASIAISAVLVIVKASGEMDVVPWQALSALLLAVAMVPFADPGSISLEDLALAMTFGLMLPGASVLIMLGPRLISAPETSLLLLLEAILGPTWIWLALGDPPTLQAVLAGIVILGAVAANAVLALRELNAAARA
jgi:drug/metabolite transporter (DMT)-like permease